VKSNAAVDVALVAYFAQNKVEIESIQRQRYLEAEEATKAALISDAVNSANDPMINQVA